MDDADRFWTGLVESSLDLNRFAGMLKARRTDLKDDSRLDRIPAFFLHGVLYIWRFLYKPASVMEVKGTNMVEALPAAAEVYVSEWLKNVTEQLQSSSDTDFDEQRERLGLTEACRKF